VSPKLLGSQGPLAQSQKTPPPVIRVQVRRAVTHGAVAHSKVPTDQWVDGRCSGVRCGECECEPSII
jgi:hypothetical protein